MARPFFFVHVMKTAGGTLREHVNQNFPPGVRYPDWRVDPADAYFDIARLRAVPEERRARIRVYIGHFPYIVSQLVAPGATTISLLRHPVERTLSLLKQRSREHEPGWPLEAIYDDLIERFDGLRFKRLLGDHQTKIFAMTADDPLVNYMDVIDLDDRRVAIARRHLEAVDVLGFQEDLQAFCSTLSSRHGWTFGPVEDQHVSEPVAVTRSFRRRIESDVAVDLELYEHARSLVRDRA